MKKKEHAAIELPESIAFEYGDPIVAVGFAELHDTIFVGGKNLSAKLDSHRNPGLVMQYNRVEKELIVTWNKVTSHVPSTNIKHYIPGVAADRKIVQPMHTQHAVISHTAQVETPMSHVHAGHGHGKTGLAGK